MVGQCLLFVTPDLSAQSVGIMTFVRTAFEARGITDIFSTSIKTQV